MIKNDFSLGRLEGVFGLRLGRNPLPEEIKGKRTQKLLNWQKVIKKNDELTGTDSQST